MNTAVSMKRIVIATLLGLALGVVCATATFSSGFLKFTPVNLVWVLLNRGVMGFAIAISRVETALGLERYRYGTGGRIHLLMVPSHEHRIWNGAGSQCFYEWGIRIDYRVLHNGCVQAASACSTTQDGASRYGIEK